MADRNELFYTSKKIVTLFCFTCITARDILTRRSPAGARMTTSLELNSVIKLWCLGKMSNGPVSFSADTLNALSL